MDTPCGVRMYPVSPGTPTSTSSCSQCGTPGSYKTRKVARTPSKQREETEPFDSLLDSFVEGLQDYSGDEGGVKVLPTSSALHNNGGSSSYCTVSCIERTVQQIPIKLEDLFSDSEIEGNGKSNSEEEHHLLQLASQHYSQSLRRRGMKGLVYNVIEQRQLRLRAERSFHKKALTKCFAKMKTAFNRRKKKRQLAIRMAQLKEHTTRARKFHHTRLLERSFLRWRAWCLYRREHQAHACQIVAKANMRTTFHLWQKFIRHKRELMRTFQAWRKCIYNNSLKKLCVACHQQKQTVLLQECFNKWVQETAIVAGEGLLSSKLHEVWQWSVCQRALRGWLLSARVSRAYRGVIQLLTRHWFNRWRFEAMWIDQKNVADEYSKQRRLRVAIALWKAEHRRSCDLRALLVKQANVRKQKCFAVWRDATERKQALEVEQRRLLRIHLSQWKAFSEHKRALMLVANKVEQVVNRRQTSHSFRRWRKQLHCIRMLRHHLLDSEAHLIGRCFSTWRKLTTSTLDNISDLKLPNLEEETDNLDHTWDSSNAGEPSLTLSSSNVAVVQSQLTAQTSDDRLSYLRDLSNQIEESLQLSSYNRKGTTNVNRTKNVVRRLFVENEPSSSSRASSTSDSSSRSTSIRLCSCLNPQIAQEVHEFQRRITDFSSSINGVFCESEHLLLNAHPSNLDNHVTISPSISITESPSCNPSMCEDMLDTPDLTPSNSSTCCPNRAFHSWLALTRKKHSLRQRSTYLTKLFRLRRLKQNFELWREIHIKTLTLRSSEKHHLDQTDMHQAKANDRIRCLREALTLWKKHHQEIMEHNAKICDTVVLTSTFKMWTGKLRNEKLLQKALSRWIFATKVQSQEKQAEVLRRYWCMSRAWIKWRKEHIREAASLMAVQHHHHLLLLQVFTVWKDCKLS